MQISLGRIKAACVYRYYRILHIIYTLTTGKRLRAYYYPWYTCTS